MMKKKYKVLLAGVFIFILLVAAIPKIVSTALVARAQQNLPQTVLSKEKRESIDLNDYAQIPMQYDELGFDAPSQKLSKNSAYWVLGENPNLLFYLHYNLSESMVEAQVLMNKNAAFPDLAQDELATVRFEAWKDGIPARNIWGYRAQTQYDAQAKAYDVIQDAYIVPDFTEKELNELRNLAFTAKESGYELRWSEENDPPWEWKRENFTQTEQTGSYQLLENVQWSKDANGPIIYDICWCYTDMPGMYYRQYYLVKDVKGKYYLALYCTWSAQGTEVGEYLVPLPDNLAKKIEAAFLQD